MTSFKTYFLRFLPAVLLSLLLPLPVSAQNMTANAEPAAIGNLNSVFATVVRSLISLVGIASFVMLLLGGFKFISAGSDKEAAHHAQQTINLAIGGLIISLSAWLLLNLIGVFLGVDLNVFNICVATGC
jgi:hypothetical protein